MRFIIAIALLFCHSNATAYNRAACQSASLQTVATACPPNTLAVGPSANFKTIQAAIKSIPSNSNAYIILIQPGTYQEQVNITRSGPVTLLGATSAPNDASKNSVTILWKAATGTKETGNGDNAFTSTLTVAPTLDASLTGSGPTGHAVAPGTKFGNTDFRAYNVDFVNDFKQTSAGPSLAVSVSYANAGFYYCRVKSYQDTVYVGKLGNAYFDKSEIAGQTDFLYGFGTAWIQSSTLQLRGCGGGITAWKGTNTTFPNKYGVYIHESKVVKASTSLSIRGKCSLGRPWNSMHRSIFSKTEMDDSIRSAGYTTWSSSETRVHSETMMAEYSNTGPGFNAAGRREGKISHVLSDSEFAGYSSPAKVFQSPDGKFGNVEWIDTKPEA
ncbi:pectin lyase-like protein [Microthyrium microscopicum]|uniref:pectinesterase n=1 Tax=Microthyrium microscopicum TaxID=703497 RepID=A0A6A6UM60_9PEZI|nr:pectin lyase-like protein [Microthyrium microscopicum]